LYRTGSLFERCCLLVLAAAFGYSVLEYGGLVLTDWNLCLLIVGVVAVVYWRRSHAESLPAAALLLAAYVAFQLLPLPLFLTRLLSPSRAGALDSLATLVPRVRFASLSVVPAATFAALFRIIGYTLIFLLIRSIARRLSERRRWLAVIPPIIVAAGEAALGLWQHARGDEVQGTYVNKNHFAGLLEMVLPFAIVYGIALLNNHGPAWRHVKMCAALIAALLMFTGVLYSASKMGFVATLGALFVMGLAAITAGLKTWKRWLVAAALATVLLFVFVFLPSDDLIAKFGNLFAKELAPGEGRWPIWLDTLRMIAAYPVFGAGLGTYETAFLKYQTSGVDHTFSFAHNDYLQLFAELGTVGFLILLAIIVPVAARAFRAARHGRDWNARCLGLGCAGSITAIALHSLADFNLYIPANALLLAWICGLSAGLPLRSGRADARLEASSRIPIRKLAMALGCVLIVYAPAWILFESLFQSDLRAESLFCRFGICDTDAVITAQILAHGGQIAAVPAAPLFEALRRDPNAPSRWCDAGEALLKSGRTAAAQFCFSKALDLGPHVPPILQRAADFYYGTGQTGRALDLTTRVLRDTSTYDSTIFSWYFSRKLPVTEVLARGLPQDRRTFQSYVRYTIGGDSIPDSEAVWNRTVSRGYVDDQLAREYLDYLFANREYKTAAQSWARYVGQRGAGYLESTWVFNGDFECEPSGSVFDWRIDHRDDVEVTEDAGVAHTGSRSLRIRFQGNENLNYSHVTQTAFVKPGRYRFEAYVRTERLTTDEGIGFRILDPTAASRLDVKTERVTGTSDWRKIDQVFEVRPQTRLIQIQVVRQPSLKFDNNISGTVWIDTVQLTPSNL
jgi:O-antigen ligase